MECIIVNFYTDGSIIYWTSLVPFLLSNIELARIRENLMDMVGIKPGALVHQASKLPIAPLALKHVKNVYSLENFVPVIMLTSLPE